MCTVVTVEIALTEMQSSRQTLGGRVTIIISKGQDDGAEATKKRIRAVYVKKTHFSPLCSSIPPKASWNAEHPRQRQLKKTTHGS